MSFSELTKEIQDESQEWNLGSSTKYAKKDSDWSGTWKENWNNNWSSYSSNAKSATPSNAKGNSPNSKGGKQSTKSKGNKKPSKQNRKRSTSSNKDKGKKRGKPLAVITASAPISNSPINIDEMLFGIGEDALQNAISAFNEATGNCASPDDFRTSHNLKSLIRYIFQSNNSEVILPDEYGLQDARNADDLLEEGQELEPFIYNADADWCRVHGFVKFKTSGGKTVLCPLPDFAETKTLPPEAVKFIDNSEIDNAAESTLRGAAFSSKLILEGLPYGQNLEDQAQESLKRLGIRKALSVYIQYILIHSRLNLTLTIFYKLTTYKPFT